MATIYKIHPAIGIARVGNSPDYFIGPELLNAELDPPGGFKDNQCRVKRQAARFRIFAHYDDNTVAEVTGADADITWTVHLVNSKAAYPGRGNSESAADLTIDPGPQSLGGPNLSAAFDSGTISFSGAPVTTVPLGEMRTDTDNHLLVLGGSGTSASPGIVTLGGYFWATEGWYDDVSDGPVTATIKLHADGSTPAVVPAWVTVAPPKFAPHQQSVITLFDRITQAMVSAGLLTAPTTTSYTNDIYPILQRARDAQWVANTMGAHAWADPVTDPATINGIFSNLLIPVTGGGGDMPYLLAEPGSFDNSLTVIQYQHMSNWANNVNFTNDWTGVPPAQTTITPDGLDRAALENCVGGPFYPGIETGGRLEDYRPSIDASNYMEPYRLNAGTAPGLLTSIMALPWQNDFFQCSEDSPPSVGAYWWPVPRPDIVIRNGMAGQSFIATIITNQTDMVNKWSNLGFILRNGSQHTEFGRCDVPSIELMTPMLNFLNIPQGPMGIARQTALAITFDVISPSSAVTLQYAPGGAPSNSQLSAYNTSVTVGPTTGSSVVQAIFWIVYTTTPAISTLPPQTVTVQDSGGTQSWTITIIGNTVVRQTVATALVFDRSGSMADDAGDGQSKHTSLQQAANVFVSLLLDGDGVGLVCFNQDAQVLQNVLALGPGPTDANRMATTNIINGSGLDPSGSTSIGDGIFSASGILTAAAGSFDSNAMLVLTDGMENTPKFIADVASLINADTYAVGLGQPQNISVPALQSISGNNGGYLLVTGSITTSNQFELTKYFVQILAGISNAEIVLDPAGYLIPGRYEKIPFQLTSADTGIDVILLTPDTGIVDFRLITPSGNVIEPWIAMSEPSMRFVLSNGLSYYRLALPYKFMPNRSDAGGTWYALLSIGEPKLKRGDTGDGTDQSFRKPAAFNQAAAANHAGSNHGVAITDADRAKCPHLAANADAVVYRRSIPYSLVVHAYSSISVEVHTVQTSFEPGAVIQVHASLMQAGIPGINKGYLWAEVERPNGAAVNLVMNETTTGEYTAHYATTAPGVYQFRVRAIGTSSKGERFTREKSLTAAVWHGGDAPAVLPSGGANQTEKYLCDLLRCLLRKDGAITPRLEKHLEELGFNMVQARECIARVCREEKGLSE